MKIVYNKSNGAEVVAYEDPKEPGRYALPASSTEVAPPLFNAENELCSWNGVSWDVTQKPEPEAKPEPEPVDQWTEMRMERDMKLANSDWRVNSDYPYDDQTAWISYRSQLRDLPSTITDINNITWPTEPTS